MKRCIASRPAPFRRAAIRIHAGNSRSITAESVFAMPTNSSLIVFFLTGFCSYNLLIIPSQAVSSRTWRLNPDFAIGQNRQDARRGRCRCMPILRTSRNAADCLFSTILKGLRIGCFFSSDMAFTFRCKRWATALHFNLFVCSTIQIPANSQTQNLG